MTHFSACFQLLFKKFLQLFWHYHHPPETAHFSESPFKPAGGECLMLKQVSNELFLYKCRNICISLCWYRLHYLWSWSGQNETRMDEANSVGISAGKCDLSPYSSCIQLQRIHQGMQLWEGKCYWGPHIGQYAKRKFLSDNMEMKYMKYSESLSWILWEN